MRVSRVTVRNFRNYKSAALDLYDGRNVLIGENAQGKTNLLEAIELIASGRSDRAGNDRELVYRGENQALIEVSYHSAGYSETATLLLTAGERMSRKAKINGVIQSGSRRFSRLTTVSFKVSDLDLLRGGPKHRRDWLDQLVCKLKSSHFELTSRYDKIIQQRNRLLKTFFEKQARLTVSDQDELRVWDKQLGQYGSQIIKQRVHALALLLPLAEANQAEISGSRESLTAQYIFKTENDFITEDDQGEETKAIGINQLIEMTERELEQVILNQLKKRRAEEIARKQTVCGPHRDDVSFSLNDFAATSYASQGQQRSLVLALKLAELTLVTSRLEEPPLLLLDDVLAELDLGRQGMLMHLVNSEMQTLITTTHLDGFRPEWIEGAKVVNVKGGMILSD
ncbi:DNA replication/repair protein RecF [bacterium]|nr:DNA replication/repair protein RecF [bacterium]MBP9808734.1 DNA replication/repair protein RecF [bacterium]